jgi:succinate dehydrogenase / fumarate reductase iron-sulfur subunit
MTQVPSIAEKRASTPLSSAKSTTLRIARFNPEHDGERKFMEFTVPYEKWTTVLEAILEVKKHFDHSVAVRYSCRQATCGSCGMMINGKPRLACFTKISELDSDVITVEPMNNFPIIRDLAVKFERLFDTHHKIKPYLIRDDSEITSNEKEFLQTPKKWSNTFNFQIVLNVDYVTRHVQLWLQILLLLVHRHWHKHTDTLLTVEIRERIQD